MQILRYSKPEQRAQVIMKLIEVTNECVKLRNYETVVQLISAIQVRPRFAPSALFFLLFSSYYLILLLIVD